MPNTKQHPLGVELERVADELNDTIMDIEEALDGYKIGLRASVWLDDNFKAKLIFGKHDGDWRLLVEDDEGNEVPLVESSRETRIKGAGRIRDLMQALVETADAKLAEVRHAVTKLKGVLEQLR